MEKINLMKEESFFYLYKRERERESDRSSTSRIYICLLVFIKRPQSASISRTSTRSFFRTFARVIFACYKIATRAENRQRTASIVGARHRSLCGGTASIGGTGRAKFESTELCSVYVDLHAIPALAIGNGS